MNIKKFVSSHKAGFAVAAGLTVSALAGVVNRFDLPESPDSPEVRKMVMEELCRTYPDGDYASRAQMYVSGDFPDSQYHFFNAEKTGNAPRHPRCAKFQVKVHGFGRIFGCPRTNTSNDQIFCAGMDGPQ